jgi:hypothetical protein
MTNITERVARKANKKAKELFDLATHLVPLPDTQPPKSTEEMASALQGKLLNCFLCGGSVEIKLTKKGRPYYQCLDCYTQTFVRGDIGIKRLWKLVQDEQRPPLLPDLLGRKPTSSNSKTNIDSQGRKD